MIIHRPKLDLFLIGQGFVDGSFNDRQKAFLKAQGIATSVQDGWFRYLRGLGYTGSLDDMAERYPWPSNLIPTIEAIAIPVIEGVPEPNNTLIGTSYTFTGTGPWTYEFVWLLNSVDQGVVIDEYDTTVDDNTGNLVFGVRATDSLGAVSPWSYSNDLPIDWAVPTFSVQPTFYDTVYTQGETVTLTIGTAGPAATINIYTFTLNGVDKTSELAVVNSTTYSWDSTGELPGAIIWRTRASNTTGEVLSTELTRALETPPVSVPSAFTTSQFQPTNEGTGGKLTVTVSALPNNGGSAITSIEYQLDGVGGWIASGISAVGSFVISGLTNGVSKAVGLRAVNSSGNGAGSATESETPSDITDPIIVSTAYDTPTNTLTVDVNETSVKYYLVNSSATVLTGSAIKAAVIAETPDVFGTIASGETEETPDLDVLSADTYYLHIAAEDLSGNIADLGSVVEFDWPGTSDIVAPVLTSATDVEDGSNGSDGTVTTDEDNGTLYWVISTSATQPSYAQLELGQMHTGAAAADSGSQVITTTGVKNIVGSGLTGITTYYTHYYHKDAAGNQSNRITADGFTTDAAASDVAYVGSTLMVNTSTSGVSFASTSDHTVGSGANRVVVLEIRGFNDVAGAAPSITTCIFGGVSGAVSVAPVGSGSRDWVASYVFVNPTAGANSCLVVVGALQRAMSIRVKEYINVNQTTPVVASGSTTSGASAGTSAVFTRTTVSNGNLLNSTVCINAGNLASELSVSGGGTSVALEQTGTAGTSDNTTASVYEACPTAGANGHTVSWTTSTRWTMAWEELGVV